MAEFAAAMSLLCLQRDRRPDDDHPQYLIPKLEQQLPQYSDDNRKSISSIHSIISNNTSLPSPTILQKRSSVSSLSIRDEYSPERISNFHHDNEVSISDGESATTPGGRKRRKPIASIKTHRQAHSVDETKSTDYLQQQQQQQQQQQHQQKPKRPYKCDRCDRPFARREHLLRHIETTHENQKDFKCEVCGRVFSRKDNMMQHTRNKHGEKAQQKQPQFPAPPQLPPPLPQLQPKS